MKNVMLLLTAAWTLATAADGPPAIYKSAAELQGALKAGQTTPDMLTSPVAITEKHRINLVKRTKAAGAVAHEGFAELHHIIDGSGTLVTGGTLIRPTGGRGSATIDGGVSKRVTKGDVILVPPGVPHWYKDLEGEISYLEVRWEEK